MKLIQERVLEMSRSRAFAYLIGICAPVSLTVIGARWALPAFVFEHLMVVIVVGLAVLGGRGPAIASAVAGGIGDNLLFREPIGRPAITGARDVVDLALFLAVAMVVGWLVDGLRGARARALEAADRERRARQELDRLVATVTHDLATPLNAIQGTIQFARKHAVVSEVDVVRLFVRVETAAARATALLRSLADTKSIEQHSLSLELRLVDLRDVVEPIVRMMDRISDRHPIGLAMDPTPLVVNGDAERLGRVVENLITNAIKYSPGGGAIEICVREDRGSVMLTVRDHGIGIPADARDRLFELGYRAPQAVNVAPGLGLGLYTASEVIRRHGGTITISAPADGGTMFAVRLPLAERPTVGPPIGENVETMTASPPSGTVH
jgi:signal transduction histidine kinase